MKLNTKNIVALMALGGAMAFAPALLAQDTSTNAPAGGTPPPPAVGGGQQRGPTADQMLERLTTRLSLTADEQTKVKPILEKQMQEMSALSSDQDRQDRRTKMMAIRDETMTNMQVVLTPDQFTQYQQMTQRRRPGMGGGAGGNTNAPAGTPPPQK